MSNQELYVLYLEEGDQVVFNNQYQITKRGIITDNYKDGSFQVKYTNNKVEDVIEIISVDQIIFAK